MVGGRPLLVEGSEGGGTAVATVYSDAVSVLLFVAVAELLLALFVLSGALLLVSG